MGFAGNHFSKQGVVFDPMDVMSRLCQKWITHYWSFRVILKQRFPVLVPPLWQMTNSQVTCYHYDLNWRTINTQKTQDGNFQRQAWIRLSKDELRTGTLSGDDRWQMTDDRWQMTIDRWPMMDNKWLMTKSFLIE